MPVEAIRLRIHTDELDGDFGDLVPVTRSRYLDNPEAEHAHKVETAMWSGIAPAMWGAWMTTAASGWWGASVSPSADSGLGPEGRPGSAVGEAGWSVAINDRPLLAVLLGPNAPDDWSDALRQQTGAEPVSVTTIPTDKRHNAKVDRVALAASLAVD